MPDQLPWDESMAKAFIDTLRLTDAQWYECLEEMESKEAGESEQHAAMREDERLPYLSTVYLLSTLRYPDGREQHFKIRTYDISNSGLGFLHGTYIHSGTKMELLLNSRSSGWVKVYATVMRCDHIKKTVHRIGAKFNEPINVGDFVFDQEEPGISEPDAA